MKRKWNKKFLALLCAVLLMLSMTGCVSEYIGILSTLKNFQNCSKEMDLDGMLQCLEPEKAETIQTGLKLVSMLTGLDDNTMYQYAMGLLLGDSSEELGSQDSMKWKLKKISLDDTKTSADVQLELQYKTENTEVKRKVMVKMVEKDGTWYISDFSLNG